MWYASTMARVEKHIAPPASPEQIRKTLGITEEDTQTVHKVMKELGYLPKDGAGTRERVGLPLSLSEP
jgi:hypothetical protein